MPVIAHLFDRGRYIIGVEIWSSGPTRRAVAHSAQGGYTTRCCWRTGEPVQQQGHGEPSAWGTAFLPGASSGASNYKKRDAIWSRWELIAGGLPYEFLTTGTANHLRWKLVHWGTQWTGHAIMSVGIAHLFDVPRRAGNCRRIGIQSAYACCALAPPVAGSESVFIGMLPVQGREVSKVGQTGQADICERIWPGILHRRTSPPGQRTGAAGQLLAMGVLAR